MLVDISLPHLPCIQRCSLISVGSLLSNIPRVNNKMDHSAMDHSNMDHGGSPMPAMCSMHVSGLNVLGDHLFTMQIAAIDKVADFFGTLQMLFTWDTTNLCLVFRWWHVRTTAGLIFSLLAVILIAAGYEALREASRRYEASTDRKSVELPSKLTPILSASYWNAFVTFVLSLVLFFLDLPWSLPSGIAG